MKTLLASLLLVVVAWPLAPARGEVHVSSTATPESLTKIKQAFPYQPTAKYEQTDVREPMDPAMMMERLTVVGSFQYRQLQQKIERDSLRKQAESFSLARGGLLLRRNLGQARLEIGSWENGGGLAFLRLRW